jgi:hypothetical protein
MSHLDEGTLHALLDGELDLAEVSEVQKHLGGCIACGSRLQEVKQVLAESHRLVGALEVPARAPRQPAPEPPRTPPPPPRAGHEHGAWDEPPVLLVPDPIDPGATTRKWLRGLRWAAVIGVVVAGGDLVTNALRPSRPVLPERDLTSTSPAVPPTVVSPEESRRPESTLATRNRAVRPSAQTRTAAPTPAARAAPVVDEPAAESVDQFADTTSVALQDSAAPDSEALALESKVETDSLSKRTAAAGVAAAAGIAAAGGDAAEAAPGQGTTQTAAGDSREADELATRRAAAVALAELDRERRRQRANAATAALPPATRAEAETVSEAAPRPPTLEQRAQIYLRIGLDEAVKQLGGPVHVIEGMSPELIGLTRSQIIPGSATNRPVVRVVYQDSRGRMILLDQQRMDAGQQAPASGSLRWAIGDVMLYLRGEPGADVLRSLQARVR